MEEKTIKELMDEIKQCANNWELKKIVDNLKEDTYYYFVYFDDFRPCCIVRKFKNVTFRNGCPNCSIYDADNDQTITFLPNSPYQLIKGKNYIYVNFDSGYAGVFYITTSLQTTRDVLRKECKSNFNKTKAHIFETFYKKCMERLKKFVQNPMIIETSA